MLESDLQKLSVTGLVTLYELDATSLGAGVMRWHGRVSFEDWQIINPEQVQVKSDIIWQGQTYSPIPIQSDGLEMRGDGKASTPELAIANSLNGVTGAISALCLRFGDFVGAKLTVISTLAIKPYRLCRRKNSMPSNYQLLRLGCNRSHVGGEVWRVSFTVKQVFLP